MTTMIKMMRVVKEMMVMKIQVKITCQTLKMMMMMMAVMLTAMLLMTMMMMIMIMKMEFLQENVNHHQRNVSALATQLKLRSRR